MVSKASRFSNAQAGAFPKCRACRGALQAGVPCGQALHRINGVTLEAVPLLTASSLRPREGPPRDERRTASRYAGPDEHISPVWFARGAASVGVVAGAAPRHVHEAQVSHARLARRRGVPPFAAVVARGRRLVTGDGFVDGECMVEAAPVPGEAAAKMVCQLEAR